MEQLWNNLFDFLIFPEKNKIKINDIYSLKNYNDKGYKIEENKPIIIRQTQFSGKFYDLLLIVCNENKDRIAIFIKIGLNMK